MIRKSVTHSRANSKLGRFDFRGESKLNSVIPPRDSFSQVLGGTMNAAIMTIVLRCSRNERKSEEEHFGDGSGGIDRERGRSCTIHVGAYNGKQIEEEGDSAAVQSPSPAC